MACIAYYCKKIIYKDLLCRSHYGIKRYKKYGKKTFVPWSVDEGEIKPFKVDGYTGG